MPLKSADQSIDAQAILSDLGGILILSGTTIIALVALLAETGTQAASVKPLVISVVFGLLIATVLVVLVIPALYVPLDDWGWARVPEAPGSEAPQGEAGA